MANNSDTVLVHDTSAGALKKIQVSNLTSISGLSKSSTTLAVDISGTTLLDEGTSDLLLIYDSSAGILKKNYTTKLIKLPYGFKCISTNLTSGDGTGDYTVTITQQV